VAALLSACRSVPPPPYQLAFAVDGRGPRVLTASRQTTVPLTIANIGTREWDPARVHLSYHWLWLVPRELASRSRWDIPYQNGIRTELGRTVAPAARMSVEARLRAPSLPGLYWLQWDMVEERVTWFAQVAPRQPRALVVIVPPIVWLLAPLPLLMAIAARRFAGADVLWCAATLLCKPFIIIQDALLEPTAVGYWLMAVVAVGLPVVAALALPRRVRPWVLLVIGIFGSLVILADVVYYRFFGDVLSTPALLGARQTGQVWGSVRTLFTPDLVWLIADWPFAVWLAARVTLRRAPQLPALMRAGMALAATAVLAVCGMLISAPRVLAAAPLGQMFRDRAVVEQLGPFGYHAYDAWNYARSTWWRPSASDADVQDALDWFVERAPLRTAAGTPAFGLARGDNLIVVQVESLQDFAVDFDVGGRDVMPHLRRWSGDAIRFTQVTDETSEGRTSDAEFLTMASLLPLDHGAAAFRYPGNHYVALPSILREHGYATLSAVPFEPGFWNRRVMHPAYGFDRSLFESDFLMTEQIGWGLNDRDFLQQMVPRLERLPQPFAAWMITLSLHHPFADFPAEHKTLALGQLEGTSFGNYLHTMHFFDAALDDFIAALSRDGLLDRSVVVVFGDHDAGFARTEEVAAAMHVDSDEVSWTLNDRVPWFIRLPTRAAAPDVRGERTMPAGQTDFAPTILGLLGIDAASLPYVGRNLLGAPGGAPIVRPYGDWLDAHHLFASRGAERVCYSLAHRFITSIDECRSGDLAARRTLDVSRRVVVADLQEQLRQSLAGRAAALR